MMSVTLPNLSAAQRAEIRDALANPNQAASYPTSGTGWNERVEGLLKRVATSGVTAQDRMGVAEARYAFAVVTGALIRLKVAGESVFTPGSAALAGLRAMTESTRLLQIQVQALGAHVAVHDAKTAVTAVTAVTALDQA